MEKKKKAQRQRRRRDETRDGEGRGCSSAQGHPSGFLPPPKNPVNVESVWIVRRFECEENIRVHTLWSKGLLVFGFLRWRGEEE